VVHGVVHEEVLGNSLFYFILIRSHHFAPFVFSIAFCLLISRKNNLGASSPKVIDPPTSQNWKKTAAPRSLHQWIKQPASVTRVAFILPVICGQNVEQNLKKIQKSDFGGSQ
jgi:hypothetical protein